MAAPTNCLLAVYADESCLGNGREGSNPGGAGGLIELAHPKSGDLVRRDFWLSEKATTNNRMALRSAIEALDIASSKKWNCVVVFTSDSRYLVDGMTSWVHDWARRGWKRKGGEIGNLELWQELVDVAANHRVEWRWVRGHNGHPQNEYANMLATRAAARQDESKGAVESGFEAWMASERERGRMSLDPSPLPEMRSFREARSLPRGETDSLF
ncbi:MAG: ribonuclease [Gemmatimonadetes bacterium]|jgi:ribonuclease HI|nr:ribonuclease [Gemmatimonadota bacterium]